MLKIMIAVLFCCYECMAYDGDYSFSEFYQPYKSLNDLNNLNNNDDYNDLWIKGSPHSSGNLEGFDNKFGIEKFPQVQTVVKGFFIVPLPSIKESPNDDEPEIKQDKPNNQSISIYGDYHELTEKNNKNESVQPSKQPSKKKKPNKPKKPEQDEEDVGFLCCRCNLI